MSDERYNGWANYPTWRIGLEIFSEGCVTDYLIETNTDPESIDAEWAEDYAEEIIFGHCVTDGIVESYARAFVNQVHWYEIASHISADLKEAIDWNEGDDDDS